MRIVHGYRLSQVIHAFARLRLGDRLDDGGEDASVLAHACAIEPDACRRLLRAAAGLRLCRLRGDGRAMPTHLSRLLASDRPESMYAAALLPGERWYWSMWGGLLETVRHDQPAFSRQQGYPLEEMVTRAPDWWSVFSAAIERLLALDLDAVFAAYGFRESRVVFYPMLHAGCSSFISALRLRVPSIRCMVGVLSGDEARVSAELAARFLLDACEVHAHDTRDRIPEGADTHVYRHYLAYLSDVGALELLRRSVDALPEGGRVVVISPVVDGPGEFSLAKLLDLEGMLVSRDARERTEADYVSLLKRAGFGHVEVRRAGTPTRVIVATRRNRQTPDRSAAAVDHVDHVDHMDTDERTGAIRLAMMLGALRLSRALYVATALRVPDALRHGPLTSECLADRCHAAARPLGRVLRTLAMVGAFQEDAQHRFGLTAVSELLLEGADSLRPVVLTLGSPWHWELWGGLVDRLTGARRREPELACAPPNDAVLDSSRGAIYRRSDEALLATVDIPPGSEVLIVGAANGSWALLRRLLDGRHGFRATLIDRPDVIRHLLRTGALNDCESCITLLESTGANGDLQAVRADRVLLRGLLHNLSDDEARGVLRACRDLLAPQARLVLCELVLDAEREQLVEPLVDLDSYLLDPNTRVRTAAELRSLVEEAGFRMEQCLETGSLLRVLECSAIDSLEHKGDLPCRPCH